VDIIAGQVMMMYDQVSTSSPLVKGGKLLAPAGSPREALARVQGEIAKIVAAPALRERFLERGVELTASRSPEEFTSYVRDEVAANARLAHSAGITAQ
jgi:tripartite-type tricarboxylate transporter receptor subunit TctC